ncbi:GGDEF domain-containing protein [Catellatospora vulcania]|uniref:GGDEF domain-containing protein n=1 Tax=Catellatospora vulcania TaxID=1460450 RepID=UPI0012D4610F|nr:diguanylate cyclase [Catellatospora vulcania]
MAKERDLAAEWVTFRDLNCAGRSAGTLRLADRVIAESDDTGRTARMITYVGAAVHLDQRGDTPGCVNDLTALAAYTRPITDDLTVSQRVLLRYAVKRLAALGHHLDLDLPHDDGIDPILADVNTLADVCDAIADQQPDKAIAQLDDIPEAIDAVGLAEPVRLRSIALSQRGDHAAALAVERDVLRVVTAEEEQLRSLLASGMSARLDQDRLRRIAAHFACQATTDPLTGLPNRRKMERFTETLARRRTAAAVGVLDLDGFKSVNDTHGHDTGDVVLQRFAGVLARTVRHGDFVARHGGDEFVAVLPRTTMAEAAEIGERIRAAVAAEDWSTVAPGTRSEPPSAGPTSTATPLPLSGPPTTPSTTRSGRVARSPRSRTA